jgi:hypothetical protein
MTFWRLDSVPILTYKPTPLGSIHRASPYLQTSDPTQDRAYKLNTSSSAGVKHWKNPHTRGLAPMVTHNLRPLVQEIRVLLY